MGGEPQLSGGDNADLLPFADRFRSGVEAVAGLHFDEHEHAAPPRYDLDLAQRRAETSRQNAVAFGDQECGRPAFGRKPKAKSDAALCVF
jgi:hypothetical protein